MKIVNIVEANIDNIEESKVLTNVDGESPKIKSKGK